MKICILNEDFHGKLFFERTFFKSVFFSNIRVCKLFLPVLREAVGGALEAVDPVDVGGAVLVGKSRAEHHVSGL